MPNYEFIKSIYDIPQHGTFESFTVLADNKPVFHWSDNYGLGLTKGITQDTVECYFPELLPLFKKMKIDHIYRIKELEKDFSPFSNPTVFTLTSYRSHEFEVNWVEL
jgi:hypothetical protein